MWESIQRLGTQPHCPYYSLFTKSTKNSKCCFVYFVQFVTYLLLQTFSFFRCYFQFLNLKQDSRTTEKKRDILSSRSTKIMPSFPNGNMSYRNTENRVTQKNICKFTNNRLYPNDPFEIYFMNNSWVLSINLAEIVQSHWGREEEEERRLIIDWSCSSG